MKFGYTIVYVADVAKTLAFFEAAFGFATKFLHESGDYGELETGDTTLSFASFELAESNLPEGCSRLSELEKPAGIEVAIVTDDVPAAIESARTAGADLIAAAKEKPWGQIVGYVRSPDGLLVEICTPVGGS